MDAVAAIYARKSKFTEKGDSISNQINLCKQYLKNINITELLIYQDEGFSGKTTDRPGFSKMYEDARQKKFSILICYKLDRISRSVADFSNLVIDLEKFNIAFVSVNEQFDTSNAMGRAMMYICSVFGQLERETISIRIRDNMYALAQKGNWLGGEVATGFESQRVSHLDANNKEKNYCILKPIKEEIDLVVLVFNKYLELQSFSKVQKYMLSNNIKTKKGNNWSKNALKIVLTNPVYVRADKAILNYYKAQDINIFGMVNNSRGILIYSKRCGKVGKNKDQKEWIYSISSHEGIISSSDWLRVQNQIITNRYKAPALGSSSIALLSGLIRCSKCGSPMHVAYGKQYADKNIKKFYYVCSLKRNSGGTRCSSRNVNGTHLDSIIIEKLVVISIDKTTLINELQKHKLELENSPINIEFKNISQGIKQNKIMLQNLLHNVSMTTDNVMVDLLFQRINFIQEDNKTLEDTLDNLKKDATSKEGNILSCATFMQLIKSFAMISDIASFEEKRKLVFSILEKVFVDGDTGKVTVKFLE